MRTLGLFSWLILGLLAFWTESAMATPTLIQRFTSSMSQQSDTTMHIRLPNKTLSGNCQVLVIQTDTSPASDPTITDDGGNTWAVGVAGVAGNQRLCMLGAPNSAATEHLTITFGGGSSPAFVAFDYMEWNNINTSALASVMDGTGSATHVATSPVATSTFTPANGSLLIQYGTGDGAGGPITKFTKGSGYTLVSAQTQQITGATFGDVSSVVQYKIADGTLQTPTYTYTGTSQDSDTIAFGLKTASSGTARGVGILVAGVQHRLIPSGASDVTFQFPHVGNLIHVASQHDHAVSSITDSDSNSYSGTDIVIAGLGNINNSPYRAVNVSPNTDLSALKITWSAGSTQVQFVTLYDVVGANTSPFVQTISGEGNVTTNVDLDTSTASSGVGTITPVNQNALIIVNCPIERHTYNHLVTPTLANGGYTSEANIPSADGAGTTLEDDDIHSLWYNGTNTSAQKFVFNQQNNNSASGAGCGHWGWAATEYKALDAVTAWASLGSAWHPGQSPGLGGISSARFQTNWWPFTPPAVVVFDPALMVTMYKHGNDQIVLPPQVVADGMTPPDNVPS